MLSMKKSKNRKPSLNPRSRCNIYLANFRRRVDVSYGLSAEGFSNALLDSPSLVLDLGGIGGAGILDRTNAPFMY